MNDNDSSSKSDSESLFADWIKTTFAFLEPMASIWAGIAGTSGMKTTPIKEKKGRVQESWETTFKTWEIMHSAMSTPESMASFLKGTSEMTKILFKVAQTGWENSVRFHKQWLQKVERGRESAQDYSFENLDEDALKIWTELYEKEFRRFFNIPQLGLTRLYQEKMNRAVDNFNIFQADTTSFLHLLYLPVEKSFTVMKKKLSALADEGKPPEDSKVYYQMWIKILEGHYMKLFQSHEYSEAMNKTLDSLSKYSAAKNDFFLDILNTLPVSTQKDMDALYKEMYLLKKKIKALEKEKR
jgi:hypothetical protein